LKGSSIYNQYIKEPCIRIEVIHRVEEQCRLVINTFIPSASTASQIPTRIFRAALEPPIPSSDKKQITISAAINYSTVIGYSNNFNSLQCGVLPLKVKCARTFRSQGTKSSPTLGIPLEMNLLEKKVVTHPLLPSSDFGNGTGQDVFISLWESGWKIELLHRIEFNFGEDFRERDRSGL
jgi:hypothetical protein